jgi:SNF2 family DNA or RNA helicase
MRLKQVFPKINDQEFGTVRLQNTPANCFDLVWFCQMYPMEISDGDFLILQSSVQSHQNRINKVRKIQLPSYQPREYLLAEPPRDYQKVAAETLLTQQYLLLGDEVGTGKTVSALCTLTDPRTLPAIVVTLSGTMPGQWKDEINRFLPGLTVFIPTKGKGSEIPKVNGHLPDVICLNYHKLSGWAEILSEYASSIIFDECQELRRTGSLKYEAAKHIALNTHFRMGLSATPIYGYGEEIWNVLNVLEDGILGHRHEFLREWCLTNYSNKPASLKDPKTFGLYLRENGIMLTRSRRDIGRELPPVSKIVQTIEADPSALNSVADQAAELARIILRGTNTYKSEQRDTAAQFDRLLRQATGVAKAPYVAAFVKLLIESGEKVTLFGWHREVYEIWRDILAPYNPVLFTGSETPREKKNSFDSFINGHSEVIFISLRAGAGIDGLQKVCRTVVFGELDWSPGVLEQCLGRVARDQQEDPVVAYYPLSDSGVDPIMARVLGIKRAQVEGIRNPDMELVEKLQNDPERIKHLAAEYLNNKTQHKRRSEAA